MSFFSRQKNREVIIVGCGSIGTKLASILHTQNDSVSIIDMDERSFSKITGASDYDLVVGDATDMDILEYAGIKTADTVIIATNDDDTNIMIAKMAKEYYKVNLVIARIEDTSKEFAYNQLDIVVINPLILLLEEIQKTLHMK